MRGAQEPDFPAEQSYQSAAIKSGAIAVRMFWPESFIAATLNTLDFCAAITIPKSLNLPF